MLIVRSAYVKVRRNGVKETLTEVRVKYWIEGRSLVRSIIQRCAVCRTFEGRPYCSPAPPPLPEFRVSEAPPFSTTGVDFAGPLYIRTHDLVKSNKVWTCLYTCCVTRAVNIDIIPDMSTETFICSLKRFCARRGMPCRSISDNGKTFKAAAKVIKGIITDEEVKQYLSHISVKWLFNLAKAPWWGGVFERMVRSTKRCLRKTIGQARLSYDELLTAVTEVEAIINSRPPRTSLLMIWRNLSLHCRQLLCLPDNLCCQGEIEDSDFQISANDLSRRVKHLNNTLNQFWRRWKHEYLIKLRESHQHNSSASTGTKIAVGDLVMVYNEKQTRGFWKMGKVENLIVGRDEKVRGATLRVSSGNGKSSVLQRPIALLYPLEINCKGTTVTISEGETAVQNEERLDREVPAEQVVEPSTPEHPRREAAA